METRSIFTRLFESCFASTEDESMSGSLLEYTYVPPKKKKDEICLTTGEKNYFVGRRSIERLPYFKKLLSMKEDLVIDLNFVFSEMELEILVKAINRRNIRHFTAYQAMILLCVATKISEQSLIDIAKQRFFETVIQEDFKLIRSKLKNIYPVVKKFLDEIHDELIEWSRKGNSELAVALSVVDFDELKKSKTLNLNWKLCLQACRDKKIQSAEDYGFARDYTAQVVSVLVVCKFQIEKLMLTFLTPNVLAPILRLLKQNGAIQFIELNYESHSSEASSEDKMILTCPDELIDLIKNTESLRDIEFNNIILRSRERKVIAAQLKFNKLEKIRSEIGLFFLASKYDAGSVVHGFPKDCVRNILEMGMK